jgi:hypothetical protein
VTKIILPIAVSLLLQLAFFGSESHASDRCEKYAFKLDVYIALSRSHTTFKLCSKQGGERAHLLVDRVNPAQRMKILLDDDAYENLRGHFQRVSDLKIDDRLVFADGSSWCIETAKHQEACYNTPESKTRQRGLEAITQLGVELVQASGLQDALPLHP